mgnify:CR=1 FL=1
MSKEIKIAGSISFGGKRLNVYGDLDTPLFKAKDISHAIGYSSGNEWRMLEMCEEDEKLKLPLVVAGQRRSVNFVTENGLCKYVPSDSFLSHLIPLICRIFVDGIPSVYHQSQLPTT